MRFVFCWSLLTQAKNFFRTQATRTRLLQWKTIYGPNWRWRTIWRRKETIVMRNLWLKNEKIWRTLQKASGRKQTEKSILPADGSHIHNELDWSQVTMSLIGRLNLLLKPLALNFIAFPQLLIDSILQAWMDSQKITKLQLFVRQITIAQVLRINHRYFCHQKARANFYMIRVLVIFPVRQVLRHQKENFQ